MNNAVEVLAKAARRAGLPAAVTLQITDNCNFRCRHCYQDHPTTRREPAEAELTLAEIDRILAEVAAAGILLLGITGGEVFTRHDTLDIVRAAHRHGFVIRLKTTGHLVTDTIASQLADLRPIQVDLSIYGASARVHEGITNVPGSWQSLLRAVRLLTEHQVKVSLSMVVMESNAQDVGAVARLAEDHGVFCTSDPMITPMENGDVGPVELRMRGATLADFYASHHDGAVSEQLVTAHTETDWASSRSLDSLPCGAVTNVVGISPTGKVKPCNLLPWLAGDLRRDSFMEIWRNSPHLAKLRSVRYAELEECNICELRPYCRRCHAIALFEHGSATGASLEACRHAVALRDLLRDRGVIPAHETALPPTWDRVDPDGQHCSECQNQGWKASCR